MIVGVDFSLTSTGVCAITDGEAECITIKSSKEEAWWLFPLRVSEIAHEILTWVAGGSYDDLSVFEDVTWVIETPAFAAKSAQLDKMLGGWWMLVAHLTEVWQWPLRVSPQQVKKYATSKGNAHKDEVLAAVIRRYPDVLVAGNDQADALVLAAIGAGVEGVPFDQHTQYQREVIEAVKKRMIEK